MNAWTQLLSQNVEELADAMGLDSDPFNATGVGVMSTRLNKELVRFANFYSSVAYGPFHVCYGKKLNDDGDFECQQSIMPLNFTSTFSMPDRKGSIREIITTIPPHRFQTSFDLSNPKALEAVANIGLIVFIILVMVVFGLVTSSSISVIALQPLERMLSVVRQRCKQIFKYFC
jgi:hypothetical protein